MAELGWIAGPFPRLVAVQAEGCAPIVRAFEQGASESEPFPDTRTVAFGITVPKALGDFIVLQAVRETDGIAIAVADPDLLAEQHHMAELEGVFICPEGGACLAAATQLRNSGWIRSGERVVVLNTGAGLKYPETVEVDVTPLAVDAPIPAPR
jgi:threonine synthase